MNDFEFHWVSYASVIEMVYVTVRVIWPSVVYYIYTYTNHKIQIQATLSFQVRTVLLISSTRGKRHNSYYANHPQRAAHLVISVGRDPKNPTTSFNGPNSTLCLNGRNSTFCLHGLIWTSQLILFQNPQILRTISSGHDVIYTSAPFPVWVFIITMVIVISFAHERKTVPNDYAPELLTRIVQSPT